MSKTNKKNEHTDKKSHKGGLTKDIKMFVIVLAVITAVCLCISFVNYVKEEKELEAITNTFTVVPEEGEDLAPTASDTTEQENTTLNKDDLYDVEISPEDLDMLRGDETEDREFENKNWAKERFDGKNNENTEIKDKILSKIDNSSSYKHKETNYQYITNKELIKTVNETLQNLGYDLTVSYGDACVMTKFTCKNDNGNKEEHTAYTLISYENKEIICCEIL